MRLYYHKTSGGAEYLTDSYVVCPNGEREGTVRNATIVVRIDGDFTRDAEVFLRHAIEVFLRHAIEEVAP